MSTVIQTRRSYRPIRWSADTVKAISFVCDTLIPMTFHSIRHSSRKILGTENLPDSVCNLTSQTTSHPFPSTDVGLSVLEYRLSATPPLSYAQRSLSSSAGSFEEDDSGTVNRGATNRWRAIMIPHIHASQQSRKQREREKEIRYTHQFWIAPRWESKIYSTTPCLLAR